MPKALRTRFIIVMAALVVGVVCLLPTVVGEVPEWWSRILPVSKLRLGLDLKGGIHLVLGVQVDKAVENATERVANDLRYTFRRKRIVTDGVRREGMTAIVIALGAASPREKIIEEFAEYPTFEWLGIGTTVIRPSS